MAKAKKKDNKEVSADAPKKAAKNISERDNLVVACGGGIVIDKENVAFLKENGIIGYNRIQHIVFSGEQEVFTVIVANGNANAPF